MGYYRWLAVPYFRRNGGCLGFYVLRKSQREARLHTQKFPPIPNDQNCSSWRKMDVTASSAGGFSGPGLSSPPGDPEIVQNVNGGRLEQVRQLEDSGSRGDSSRIE
ncbi:hypothetical protein PGTUg99_017045 [Puccinia graminis f. sp. tritici]|uniref:Uncharacterized protein n=1 Tax=Puccinia graminis f. sp. tritici TaxID=56615 RepID=A0A5B0S9M7_PUCGR|nr:hypothetical protein PGTUg99_017045 [Puccinia graminis f. sp. tritici]